MVGPFPDGDGPSPPSTERRLSSERRRNASQPHLPSSSASAASSATSRTSAGSSCRSSSSKSVWSSSRASEESGSTFSGSMTSTPFGTNPLLRGRRSAFSSDSAGSSTASVTQRSAHQRVAAVTVVMLAAIMLTSMVTTPSASRSSGGPPSSSFPPLRSVTETRYTEIIARNPRSKLLGEGGKVDYGECELRPAKAPNHPITPTFMASYPGSGDKMAWFLIEAITGLVTGDDFQLNGHGNMVSIKTHYPSLEGREIPGAENIPRAVILLRHPLYSFPSYHDYLYKMKNQLVNHSTRAPLESWIAWRDANFDRQLQVWKKLTEYWMDHYPPVNRLVVSFERMTSEDIGPIEATRLAEFLSRSEGVTTRPPEEIPCVWQKVVRYNKKSQTNAANEKEEKTAEKVLLETSEKGDLSRALNPRDQNEKVDAAKNVRYRRLEDDTLAAADVAKDGARDPAAPCQGCSDSDANTLAHQRNGSVNVAPFTEKQLRDIIQVLSSLLERYRDERVMAPILVGYIDEVERRVRGKVPQGIIIEEQLVWSTPVEQPEQAPAEMDHPVQADSLQII